MSDERFILCNKTTDSNVWDTLEKQCYGWEYVVSLLNELHEENEQLKQKIQRWKTLYEIKDKEVTARVDALNKVCNYYLNEIGFKSDVDPNKAVKEVINRILNTEVENDE